MHHLHEEPRYPSFTDYSQKSFATGSSRSNPPMTVHFFTVFDKNYAPRGLVMLDSLRRVSRRPVRTVVLALDEDAYRVAGSRADEVLRIEDLADADFLAAKSTRSHEEFCWTCAPVLSHYMLKRTAPGDFAAYVDADLYFYADPDVLIAEMGSDKNILIHPHRFSPDRTAWEATAGTFNVGFVGFRISDGAMACVTRWRQQVLDLCIKDPEKGLCGDQGYLNEWPSLYPDLRIMRNIGGGTAPWNVCAYRVAGTPERPTVDEQPVVFFHFHQLRIVDCGKHRFLGALYATGYDLPVDVDRYIYRKYVERLQRQTFDLARLGVPIKSDLVYDFATFFDYVAARYIHPVNAALYHASWIRWITPPVLRRTFGVARRRLKRLLSPGSPDSGQPS
jgi:hypothetical protein